MPSGYPGTKSDHGNYSRYTKWGCRCELCRSANREHRRNYKMSPEAKQHRIKYDHDKRQQNKHSRQEYIRNLKSVPCKDCNKSFPWYCMDFDHIPERGPKLFDISNFCSRQMAWQKLDAEIAKCDIVCGCCHRIRSRQRQFPEEFPLPPKPESI